MSDEYQKMSELLDNWLSDNKKGIKLAFIEKEILLEKLRKLYVKVSAMETEEYEATVPVQPAPAPDSEPQKQFTPAKTLEEDVDLFFDTEHESYKAVEEELKTIAEEIHGAQEQPASPKPEPKPEPEKVAEPEPDIFAEIEKKEKPVDENAPLTDDAEELFIETDFEISAQPEKTVENPKPVAEKPVAEKKEPVVEKPIAEKPIVEKPVVEKKEEPVKPMKAEEKKPIIEKKIKQEVPVEAVEEDFHEEDDILKFIPPKSAPAQPAKQTPAPTPKPQRSLNDLFNERREDHSISSQYQRAKVGDLTKAISINDKFIYIKELFHNRGEDFSASIRQLNECQNMEEAFDCLEELKQKYFWDSKSDAYLSFCDLLRRKYS